jgi:hypothetical protein
MRILDCWTHCARVHTSLKATYWTDVLLHYKQGRYSDHQIMKPFHHWPKQTMCCQHNLYHQVRVSSYTANRKIWSHRFVESNTTYSLVSITFTTWRCSWSCRFYFHTTLHPPPGRCCQGCRAKSRHMPLGWQKWCGSRWLRSNIGTRLVHTMYAGSAPHGGGKDLLLLNCIASWLQWGYLDLGLARE